MKRTLIPILLIFLLGIIALFYFYKKPQESNLAQAQIAEKIYVAVEGSGQVVTIDPETRKVLKRIDLSQIMDGKMVSYMAHNVQVAPDNKSVWVTANAMSKKEVNEEHGDDEVIIINPYSDTIIKRIEMGQDLHLSHVAVIPDGLYAIVASQEQGILYKINTTSFEIEKEIATEKDAQPHGLRIAPDGKTAYIAMLGGKSMGVLDLANFTLTYIPIKGAAVQTGVTSDGKYALASVYDTKSLAVYEIPSAQLSYIDLPNEAKGPVQIYPTPDSRYVYVADQGYYFDQPESTLIYKIDLRDMRVSQTIQGGTAPHGVVVDRDGKFVYVTNLLSDDVSIIDTTTDTEVAKIGVGEMPNGISIWYGQRSTRKEQSSKRIFSTSTFGVSEAEKSGVVELNDGDTYDMTASIVKNKIGNDELKMLAYNGMIPGPLIKVSQNAEINLNFTNNTDVETTIHSHGVRLENQFDGVPDVTQKAVKPGESFTYKIKFPDEGVYWYHPHIREDYAQELGLYGNYLVAPASENYWSSVNREEALFLDDILIENGEIAPFSTTSADHTLMGRFGNTMLVNGETNYSLEAKEGEIVRFYLTNSANTRTFNFSIPDAQMKLVGGDNGKYERETWSDGVILSPSERAIIEVFFAKTGTYQLQHKTPERTYTLGTVNVLDEKVTPSFEEEFNVLRTNNDIIADIDTFRSSFNKPIDKRLKLTIDMGGQMQGMMGNGMGGGHNMHMMGTTRNEPIEWEDTNDMMNEISNPSMMKWVLEDEDTDKRNEAIDWKFEQGEKVKISLKNDSTSMHPMQHPIHIHGQRFLVLSTNDEPNENLVWNDTVLIPNGDTVELLVDMSNPGDWMMHCHIAEHLEAGMMLGFNVE